MRAATTDQGAAVVNGTRAAGGGGGGIVFPAARAVEGAVKTVDVAGSEGCAGAWCCKGAGAGVGRRCGAVGTEKVTEAAGAAGRVAAPAGGGCRELGLKLGVNVSCWRLAVAISAAVEHCWVST